jgi:putative AdoMet-dependent methyltransferase
VLRGRAIRFCPSLFQESRKMTQKYDWYYDEMAQVGTDYNDPAEVKAFDERHERFRDYVAQGEAIARAIDLKTDQTIIDLGVGTGAFSLYAAGMCKTIHAVDVSKAMLTYTSQKAEAKGIGNIDFHYGGFLTYEHKVDPVDAVVSVAALHHLPDVWKMIALRRLAKMIKPGGKFYLKDVVFSFEMDNHEAVLNGWVDGFVQQVGPEFKKEVEGHVRDEYSTTDWIMEGILKRTGFRIDEKEYTDEVMAVYVCTRI